MSLAVKPTQSLKKKSNPTFNKPTFNKPTFNKPTFNKSSVQGLYNQILITQTVPVHINNIGDNIKETLEKAISSKIEGKCIVDGYIKPNTVDIITFSSGLIKGEYVIFEVVFQCLVCSPVEGMHIKCIAKNINKAGIRAEVNEKVSPVVIFIARDHNYTSPMFSQVKENDEIKVRVIGQRFELNDKYISIIAELLETSSSIPAQKKPMIELDENELINIGEEIEEVAYLQKNKK
jgi:DNA-directed RNA polymerase subunit E'/Rpb7